MTIRNSSFNYAQKHFESYYRNCKLHTQGKLTEFKSNLQNSVAIDNMVKLS